MAIATEQQLKERWETPEGKKVKELILKFARDENWPIILKKIKLPFIEEINNNKDLRGVDFEQQCNITFSSFYKARLSETDFSYSNLKNVYFIETDLHGSIFKDSILEGTHFEISHLQGVDFQNLIFNKTIFVKSYMMHAKLQNSTFLNSDFREAYLVFANFCGSKFLNGTSFIDANLDSAIIENSIFDKAVLNRTNLHNTNLKNSVIRSTDLSYCLFIKTDLIKTKIVNSKVYGISVWDITTNKNTIMKNLIINKDPLITVDDIEIAQFIYSLLNNEKIRNVIDTMRTKGVLILGSFSNDKKNKITPKKVLDKIKEELLKKNYVPIVFDFDPSKKLDLISTVKTLALLSSFIIVDLSTPAGQLTEIGNLVREFPIPFIPIASNETEHITSMVSKKALGNYHWFKKDIIYYSIADFDKQLPKVIESEIIPWVKNKNRELEKERGD